MKIMTITLIMSGPTFLWKTSQASKKASITDGGIHFNEFLIDEYLPEMMEKFPEIKKGKVDAIIPKIFLRRISGEMVEDRSISKLMVINNNPERKYWMGRSEVEIGKRELERFNQFLVHKEEIVNPLEVGI